VWARVLVLLVLVLVVVVVRWCWWCGVGGGAVVVVRWWWWCGAAAGEMGEEEEEEQQEAEFRVGCDFRAAGTAGPGHSAGAAAGMCHARAPASPLCAAACMQGWHGAPRCPLSAPAPCPPSARRPAPLPCDRTQAFLLALGAKPADGPFAAKAPFWEKPGFVLWTAAADDSAAEEARFVAADPV
jgi:hypothetical protein